MKKFSSIIASLLLLSAPIQGNKERRKRARARLYKSITMHPVQKAGRTEKISNLSDAPSSNTEDDTIKVCQRKKTALALRVGSAGIVTLGLSMIAYGSTLEDAFSQSVLLLHGVASMAVGIGLCPECIRLNPAERETCNV